MQQIFNSLNVKADWWGLREISDELTSVQVRNGKLDNVASSIDKGYMAEVLVDGQFCYFATTRADKESLQHAFDKAIEQAQLLKKYQLTSFTSAQRPKANGKYQPQIVKAITDDNVSEVIENLVYGTKSLKGHGGIDVISRVAMGYFSNKTMHFYSSNGSDYEQTLPQSFYNLSMTASYAGDNQSLGNGGKTGQFGLENVSKDILLEQAEMISKDIVDLLKADNCPTDTRDLLILPDQMYLQVHESIGHPLELDRILGDERNYAGWSFINLEDFGQLQYGSPLLNVTFDPGLPGEMATYDYDDTGAPAEKIHLIKEGKLLAGIGSLESQQRTGVSGVACSRMESWNRPPIDRMGNINVELGDASVDDMIAATEKGILMRSNQSWSIDDYRNKFQFGCQYGRLIENGELTKVVKNPNYRGNCTPFWNSLKMLGDASTFEVAGTFYCGKGEPNQIIRVGHAIPAALFSNIEVFGGGK